MTMFLLSSSIIENSLIPNLDYIIGRDITKIVVLRENHTEYEYSEYSKHEVVLCNTIFEATAICDFAIIILPPNVTDDRYETIYKYVKTKIRDTYFMNLNRDSCWNEISRASLHAKDIPTILILAIGRFHQVQNIEISLNEIFSKNQIKFRQSVSHTTVRILHEFRNQKLLNPKIDNSLSASDFDVMIQTWCSDSFELAFNDMSLLKTVYEADPSYVFLACERNFQSNSELISSFQYRLNCKFNSVIYSDYVSIIWDEIPTPILITKKINSYLSDKEKESLWDDIVNRIVFPDGLKVIVANR